MTRGLLTILIWASATAAATAPPAWPYQTDLDSYLLHVHPEVNYALHPEWLEIWERDRLARSLLRGTFGSVATRDLLVDTRWALNTELAHGLWLRNDILWQDVHHLPFDHLDIRFGLEQEVWRGIGVVAEIMPTADKEEMDLRLGAIWTSGDRTRYLQLSYVAEDFIHDSKAPGGARTLTAPRGVAWLVRLAGEGWSVYSRGRWLAGFSREFDEAAAPDELAAHARTDNDLELRGRWHPGAGTHLELAFELAENAEAKSVVSGAYDYDWSNWYRVIALRGLQALDQRWRLRLEVHQLHRRDTSAGWHTYAFHRRETMPAVWLERRVGVRHKAELGYMGTVYRWGYEDAGPESGFADKLELGFTFGLADASHLTFSLSHEVSLDKFGGGNVQVLTRF